MDLEQFEASTRNHTNSESEKIVGLSQEQRVSDDIHCKLLSAKDAVKT